MANLKIRNNLISDLELFRIKGASCIYRGVSCTREPTVGNLLLAFCANVVMLSQKV